MQTCVLLSTLVASALGFSPMMPAGGARVVSSARPPVTAAANIRMDIERTYMLEASYEEVVWRHIPLSITPMNRILVARRPTATADASRSTSRATGG